MEQFTILLIALTITSLILLMFVVAFTFLKDFHYRRQIRREQRDRNSKCIETIDLRLEVLEERLGLLESKSQEQGRRYHKFSNL